MRYRDASMAANTAWWLRHRGGRILLASNNGHVACVSESPEFPEPVGAFLRRELGDGYVSIGLTFDEGTINAPPAAKDWLSLARPTRSYGLFWSSEPATTALAHAYDAVIHLHTVRAADLVRGERPPPCSKRKDPPERPIPGADAHQGPPRDHRRPHRAAPAPGFLMLLSSRRSTTQWLR